MRSKIINVFFFMVIWTLINHSGSSSEPRRRAVSRVFRYTRANVYHERRRSSGSRHQLPRGLLHDCIAGVHHTRASRYIVGGWWIRASVHRGCEKGKMPIARLSTRTEACERNRDASGCRGVTNDVVKIHVGANYSRCIIPVQKRRYSRYFARTYSQP